MISERGEKHMRKKRTVFVIMVFILLQTVFIIPSLAADSPQKKDPAIAILFTNDVHCYYDRDIGYDGLVLYAKELEQQYEHVILVDAGDAIQGAPIGAISKGKEFIRIMNEAGYDIAILGNHEFDYGFEVLDDLGEQLECGYICANFCTSDGETVYDPYRILECGDTKVAFISVDTPDTFSKSKIRDMVDDQGVPMYDFKSDESGETLYACLQGYIDDVKEKGADYVILVAHLGDGEDATQAYRSNEVVAHLTGLDAVIDGHSHNTYNTTAADAEGKEIPLVQTGAYFQNVGKMILHPDGTINVDLLEEIPAPQDWMEGIEAVTVTRKDRERFVDAGMHQFLEDITAAYADIMDRKVGESAFDMVVREEDGTDISRFSENGLCELVADAFRQIGDTDISIVNAGSVRNNLPAGEITFNTIMDVLPYSTNVVIAELKGQTILDALEYGCKDMPVKSGAFPQVSGLEFTVDPNIKSSVETNEVGDFVKVASERRVSNVLVDGKPLDPEATYTITTAEFLLTGGDHYTMFKDDARITGTTNMTDNTLLAEYIEKNLNGVIPENYRQAEGRIHVIEEETEALSLAA